MKGEQNTMAECKHEQHMLMGTADGIVCRGCGKLFHDFDEITPQKHETPAELQETVHAEKPKSKGGRKKA